MSLNSFATMDEKAFRDIQIAMDVRKKAELGWFDTEFTMCGCAYLKDGNMYYKISPKAQDIYDFIEKSMCQGIYPSNVMKLVEKRQVPSGTKEIIEQQLKKKLGKMLQSAYSKEFFECLYNVASKVQDNEAASLLWSEAEDLEGIFEEEKLYHFEELVHYIRGCGHIDVYNYRELLHWISEERKNMGEEFFISKNTFEKTMYGIAYELDGQIKYAENAQKTVIYEKRYLLERKGCFVTNIFSKTYWYDAQNKLENIRNDFKETLITFFNVTYLAKIKKMSQGMGITYVENFKKILETSRTKFSKQAVDTLIRYGERWGII